MKNVEYKQKLPIKETLRPTAQDISTVALELVDISRKSLGNPAGVLAALGMAYRAFELDGIAGGMDEKAMTDATDLGIRMADAYHKIQEGKRAKAETQKTGLVGLDGKFMSTADKPLDSTTNKIELT